MLAGYMGLLSRQDVFVRAGRFLDELQGLEPPGGKARVPCQWGVPRVRGL